MLLATLVAQTGKVNSFDCGAGVDDEPRPIGQRAAISTQRRKWARAASGWEHHGMVGLSLVIDAVLAEAGPGPVGVAIDVGAGTGAVAVPLAAYAERVIALDVSRSMLDELEARAEREGVDNIEVRVAAIEEFDMEPASVDLVVSNYAVHHLLDRDKRAFVERVTTWLRPGGKLIIGDMMFGRGVTATDRAIIGNKVRIMLRRGPGGWWRLVKNGWRFATRTVERPISVEAWVALLRDAGLVAASGYRVVAEAAVVTAMQPVCPGVLPDTTR